MYELPTTVPVNGTVYNIRNKADYRLMLDVIATYEDTELTEEERVVIALIIFYEDVSDIEELFNEFNTPELIEEAVLAMFDFMNCYNQDIGYKAHHKLIDWVQDEQLIVSAINRVAGFEIRAVDYMHWWTFIANYMAVGESTLSTVVGIRDKIARGKKLEKSERDFKRDNPQYFTWKSQKEEADKLLEQLWNKE